MKQVILPKKPPFVPYCTTRTKNPLKNLNNFACNKNPVDSKEKCRTFTMPPSIYHLRSKWAIESGIFDGRHKLYTILIKISSYRKQKLIWGIRGKTVKFTIRNVFCSLKVESWASHFVQWMGPRKYLHKITKKTNKVRLTTIKCCK